MKRELQVLTFSNIEDMVKSYAKEVENIKGTSFLSIPELTTKTTGEKAKYLIDISPNLHSKLKKKEEQFFMKYAHNEHQDALVALLSKIGEREPTDTEKAEIETLNAKARAKEQYLRELIKIDLVTEEDEQHWNFSKEILPTAIFALWESHKNPNQNRRTGAIQSFIPIGETGIRFYPNTGNFTVFGLVVRKNSILPPTNPRKQGARELTRAKDFVRVKYLKKRGNFIIGEGMSLVINGKQFRYIEGQTVATNENLAEQIAEVEKEKEK